MRMKRLLALLLLPAMSVSAAGPWRFDFGGGDPESGYTRVAAHTVFDPARGYGFEPGSVPVDVDRGEGAGTASTRDFVTADGPFSFSVVVPEGNHRVTVVLGDAAGEGDATVKAESRRLMAEAVRTAKGEFATRSFVVNVRNSRVPPPPENAPGGSAVVLNDREIGVRHWDDKLTLEFTGPSPKVCALVIEAVDVPTIYLVGDSTVTDQPREPGASWGQMLTRFLDDRVAVANHAESGETMKSFISGLRLAKVLSAMKAGDWLFVQFGHNDQKQQWPQTWVEARSTYRAYLRVLIAEARLRGATPVLVTSMQRRQFDELGRIRNSLGDYPEAVRAVAREEGVALIDLERMSVRLYEALGPDTAPRAFAAEGRDPTHHNNYGAYQLAQCVAQGIREAELPLAAHLVSDFSGYDPSSPDDVDAFSIAPSDTPAFRTPRGN
ncbi:rhamnogalacturonan acetylesterase [Opitutales bacterium ASA1]|uniref:rhamnogalacturonan acetylesterase n=1 Tax=Congregicoccus parvus TaxID=3081749 RepID=UPI002B298473|nr:rhamnogalacturonan acetylesterase [Opitutales bacterium ASA1]